MKDIEHVIVLMLENRSFDHMLGFLDHPDPEFSQLKVRDPKFSNPIDPTKLRKNLVYVTDDSGESIDPDPSHSHASVMNQMGVGAFGPPRMNGFVAAHARKAAGREEGTAVVHWGRIAVAASVLATFLCVLFVLLAASISFLSLLVAVVIAGLLVRASKAIPGLNINPWLILGLVLTVSAVGLVLVELLEGFIAAVALTGAALVLSLGFIRLKRKQAKAPPPGDTGADSGPDIMKCMRPQDRLPALATLAAEFAVCTKWHCSVPGATWPNRNFVHSGSSDGTVDIEVDFYDNDTIFDRLEQAGKTWSIYYDGLPQVAVFKNLWEDDSRRTNWYEFGQFFDHIDNLPNYVFIEPRHDGDGSNSQHPGNNDATRNAASPDGSSDFVRGDRLIASIYEALRARPQVFARSALVITYDEHGGFYDHEPPPTDAVDPTPLNDPPQLSSLGSVVAWLVEQPKMKTPFRFSTLGPRVPTVVVSPMIAAGRLDDNLYDHTSIPATVRSRFAPETPPLSEREGVAGKFSGLFDLENPRTDLPNLSSLSTPELGRFQEKLEASPTVSPRRKDEFGRQLHGLAVKLDAQIPATAEGTEEFQQLKQATDLIDEVANRFSTWSAETRSRE